MGAGPAGLTSGTLQSSVSLQEPALELAYVGNRGVWLEANDLVNVNAINPARLQALGLDLNNPADRTVADFAHRLTAGGFARLHASRTPDSRGARLWPRPFGRSHSSTTAWESDGRLSATVGTTHCR